MKRKPSAVRHAGRALAFALVCAMACPAQLFAQGPQGGPGNGPGGGPPPGHMPPIPLPPPDRQLHPPPRSDDPWSGQPDVRPTPLVLPDMPRIRIRRGKSAGAGGDEIPRARPQGEGELVLSARLVDNGDIIPSGLIFRVFEPETGAEGKLPLIATATGGKASFKLPAGPYLIHASFGRAGATRRINITPDRKSAETLVLDAGGLKLSARLPDDGPISDSKVRFTVYEKLSGVPDEQGSLVLPDVKPGSVIRLPAGDYHIVSNYGKVNASTGVDIRVDAGKLTDASVEIAASEVTLKLVRNAGGEAIADTSWIIQSDSGEKLAERIGAFTTLVLAEGEYNIIARNRDQFYTRQISVSAGRHNEIEVVASQVNQADSSEFLAE
ncbi:hypothetical protein [Notoacmeibacter sp. MSK16QG-6]|uniref:hypothetical protein n=1 Tax=Notoacmeibacter sp. MSK16QG-6 TaxID=2957982 RepID=UPI00209EF017|nr:hypothetical protein [Notoacmeibacter sp. MSK16QG-6]MCP1199358.1 hypothetical protein [Notoacmeibacter sp. MSK16QG-6]